MKRAVTLLALSAILLVLGLGVFPVQAAAGPKNSTNASHFYNQDQPQPVVHAVLFWMDGCPHCHEVLDTVLPPLHEKYGALLEITLVEVVSMEDVNRLYDLAATYGLPPEQVGVPFLIIGDRALVGSQQIPAELPGLIEAYLAQGGVDRPSIPNLSDFGSQPTPAPLPAPTTTGTIVRATLFTTPDCHECQLEVSAALEPVQAEYGDQLEVRIVDIVSGEDVEYLYQVAEGYRLPREQVDLPLIIIGEQVLIGERMAGELPGLVASYLAAGGVDWPALPARSASATPEPEPQPADPDVSGFALAIVVMVAMLGVLAYSLFALWQGKTFQLPSWSDWLVPALIVIGIGVAGYLAYVETQSVPAVCGPIGDCNAVQHSRYAKLFGILPVGVLGLLGYLALLAAWLARRFVPRLEMLASMGFFGMAFFAVVFSLYLTYLEPFVIKAVCMWCLASAVIVTLLLMFGTPSAVLQRTLPGSEDYIAE